MTRWRRSGLAFLLGGLLAVGMAAALGADGSGAVVASHAEQGGSTAAFTLYLPLVVRRWPTETVEVIDVPAGGARIMSRSFRSCDDAARYGHLSYGWERPWGEPMSFNASCGHILYDPACPPYGWCQWEFHRGYLWAEIPTDLEGEIISGALYIPACYDVRVVMGPESLAEVLTRTQVEFYWGVWPGLDPQEVDAEAAWTMFEADPFAVMNEGDFADQDCHDGDVIFHTVPLPPERLHPGAAVKVVAKDGQDYPGCTLRLPEVGIVTFGMESTDLTWYVRLWVRRRIDG